MKYHEAARKLKALGCEEIRRKTSGSHRIWLNPATNQIAPLPDWGAKDLKVGTLHAVVRQLGLAWDAFESA